MVRIAPQGISSGRSLDPVREDGTREMIAVPIRRDTEFGLQTHDHLRVCFLSGELPFGVNSLHRLIG